jgi:hypothetical protein
MKRLLSIAVAMLHLLAVDAAVARTSVSQPLPSQFVPNNTQPIIAIPFPLAFKNTPPGKAIKPGTELRILPVGDSITYGFLSNQDGGDGNGYRLRLREDLSSKTSSPNRS